MKCRKISDKACNSLNPLMLSFQRRNQHLLTHYNGSPDLTIDKKEVSTICTSSSSKKGKKRSLDRYMGSLFSSSRTQESQDLHTDVDIEYQQQQYEQEQKHCQRLESLENEPQPRNLPEIMRTIEYTVERAFASRKPE